MNKLKDDLLLIDLESSSLTYKTTCEGFNIYTSQEVSELKDLKRIITKGIKIIKKDYGKKLQLYMIKDFKTKIKIVLEFRKVVGYSNRVVGIVKELYSIDFHPYSNEDGFYSDKDSAKTIEKKLKKKSKEGYFLHYYFSEYSFCMNLFEDGQLYKTYEIINLGKEK